jgi:uncharacterized protein
MDYNLSAYICIAIAALLIGFSKTSVGGFGILAIPLMAIGFPGKESTGVILPLLVFADLLAVLYYRRGCDWSVLIRFFPLTAVGVLIGYFILDKVPDRVFNLMLGVTILAMLGLGIVTEKIRMSAAHRWSQTVLFGVLAGIATMLANAAGPLLGIYFLSLGFDKAAFVGTRSWYFLLLNAFKLPFSASIGLISLDSLALNAACIPLVIFGGWIGVRVINIMNERVFRHITRGAAVFAAGHLIYTSLVN